ncbi:MAG: RNA methyltransferase [Deltaproteobacteria bacterium]|nr:RNA methyltransferase [Deltaproteobacteria bacterium]
MSEAINLNNIYVVLSETKGPMNVGSVARAMNNMGLRDLALVNPCEYTSNEARKMASGCNDTLLGAGVYKTTKEAVSEAGFVVGMTCRKGKYRQNVVTSEEMAGRLAPISRNNRVALLFGTERTGLTNEEIALCDLLVTIPSSTLNVSLNLAQAVLLVCYDIFKVSTEAGQAVLPEKAVLATSSELEQMYEHMEDVFGRIGYIDKKNPGHIMMSIRNIFARAHLDSRDVKILRGMIGKIDCFRKWIENGQKKRGARDQVVMRKTSCDE